MSFTTPKGTPLQILKLKGKDYLPVQQRMIWFREEKPDYAIETEPVTVDATHAVFKATIKDSTGRVLATAHKTETKQGFQDFIEKAETGSIGRALALIGYGTQFAVEMDEGDERVVDAPVEPQRRPVYNPTSKLLQSEPPKLDTYIIPFGKKFVGKKMTEIPKDEVQKYLDWLQSELDKKGEEPNHQVKDFLLMADQYLTE